MKPLAPRRPAPAIASGRWTHQHDGQLTVFVIGMRINRFWRFDAWMPVVAAMPPMLQELARDKESGYLGHYAHFGLRGPILIQYWRTPEDVYRFATDRDATHRPAWSAFNARARRLPGAVGIWHETYQIARAETVYADMPPTGLAAATTPVRISAATHQAPARMSALPLDGAHHGA